MIQNNCPSDPSHGPGPTPPTPREEVLEAPLPGLELVDVLLAHARHARVADDQRAAHAAAVTGNVRRVVLGVRCVLCEV